MSIVILQPKKNEKVRRNFTAHGTYQHAKQLVAFLLSTSKLKLPVFGELIVNHAGIWNFTFRRVPVGKYVLVIKAIGKDDVASRRIEVINRVHERNEINVYTPLPGTEATPTEVCTTFSTDGDAVPAGPRPPRMRAQLRKMSDGDLVATGTLISGQPSAPDFYWAFEFTSVPTDSNPCFLRIMAGGDPPDKDVEHINVVDCSEMKAKKKKKGKKRSR